MLDQAGISYEINPRLVRGLDYYSRTVFEWVTDALGSQGAVCSGGRYDGLVEKLGGKSVKPYQPADYYEQLNFPRRTYKHDSGMNQYRRGLYTHWQRTFLHPMLKAFDAPSREECTAQRPTSNTPLQALTLLNDPSYVEAARVFAERVIRSGGDGVNDKLTFAYQTALAREPKDAERKLLGALYENHKRKYAADEEAAKALLSAGEYDRPADLPVAEAAAWTSVARAILNLHETISRY